MLPLLQIIGQDDLFEMVKGATGVPQRMYVVKRAALLEMTLVVIARVELMSKIAGVEVSWIGRALVGWIERLHIHN